MPVVLWVALGGAIGSAARYGVNVWSGRMFGTEFPWHTLIVNVLGCFVMGVLTEMLALKLHLSHEARAFLTTGILCGYAAWKRSGSAAVGAALLFGIALLGRLVSIALDGPAPGGTPPMVIEAVCVAILLWARSVWKKV